MRTSPKKQLRSGHWEFVLTDERGKTSTYRFGTEQSCDQVQADLEDALEADATREGASFKISVSRERFRDGVTARQRGKANAR